MRILISHECSGRIREAIRALHPDWPVYSNDIKPADDGSPYHIQADALQVAYGHVPGSTARWEWDGIIAHPVCTYLTNSAAWAYKDGPYHQELKPATLSGAAPVRARSEAVAFFLALWNAPIPRKRFENPAGIMSTAWRKPSQIIQPYQFGDDASKGTCLWNEGWPDLVVDPAQFVPPRLVCDPCRTVFTYGQHKCPACGSHEYKPRWANQTDTGQNRLSPGEGRAAERSVTYPGIARAIAAACT